MEDIDIKGDEYYMSRALDLAYLASGATLSNPMVGCVIVENGVVIAEGYHKKYGDAHAEIDALSKLEFKAEGATMYVTLEPCSHHGKTPPCAEAVVKAGVKKVVIAMMDPNKLVNGAGVEYLRANGVEVIAGVLEEKAVILNERYIKWITSGLPFVLAKCALTLDAKLSVEKGVKSSLSCLESQQKVHKLREDYDAIAVGIGTVLCDDPLLTCRPEVMGANKKFVRNPLRVIFDAHLQIPMDAKLLKQIGNTLIFCGALNDEAKAKREQLLSAFDNVEICELDETENGKLNLQECLRVLGEKKITGVLLEGGAEILSSFFDLGLVDKFSFIYTPHFSESKDAPSFLKFGFAPIAFERQSWELVGSDAWFTTYVNPF